MDSQYSVARNTTINAGAAIVTAALNLLLTALLAHGLSREQFGVWAFLIVLTFNQGYFALLDGGMSISALRKIVRYDHTDNDVASSEVLATLRGYYVFVSAGGSLVLFIFGSFLLQVVGSSVTSQTKTFVLLTLVFRLFTDTMHNSNMMILESRSEFIQLRLLDVASLLSWTMMVSVILWRGGGLQSLSIASAVNGGLLLALSTWLGSRGNSRTHKFRITWNRSVAADLWKTGKWASLQRIWGILYAQMDRTILALVLGVTIVGDYEIPYKFQAFGVLVLSVFPSAIFPSIAKLDPDEDRVRLTELFHKATRWTVGLSIPLMLTGIALSEPLIHLWLGDSFTHLHNSVSLFLLWPVVACFHVIGSSFFNAMGKTKESFVLSSVSVTVNLVISTSLAWKYGLNGVILGTVLGYLVIFIPYLMIEQRLFGDGYRSWFKNVVTPAFPALLVQVPVLLILRMLWNRSGNPIAIVSVGAVSTILGWVIFVLSSPEYRENSGLKGIFQFIRSSPN